MLRDAPKRALLGRLQRFGQSGLFQNAVCGETRPQLAVDNDADRCFWIPPNLVIAATLPLEFVAVFSQQPNDVAVVVGHRSSAAVSRSLERATISIEAGGSEESLS